MSARKDLFFGPGSDGPTSEVGLRSLQVPLAAVCIVVGAYLTLPVPGSPAPQSLQTLAVILTGTWLGWGWGSLAVALYLGAGAAGLPVFADGAAGASHLVGPTAGYLWAFLLVIPFISLMDRRFGLGRFGNALVTFLLAHALVLGLGWARLQLELGAGPAVDAGVTPFILGGIGKSLLAAMAVTTESIRRPS